MSSYKIQVLNTCFFNKTECCLKTLRLVLCWLSSLLPIIWNWWQLKLSLKNRATWNWTEHIFLFVVWHILYFECLGYFFFDPVFEMNNSFQYWTKGCQTVKWISDTSETLVSWCRGSHSWCFLFSFFFSLPNSMFLSFQTSPYWQLVLAVRSTGANMYIVSIILWKHIVSFCFISQANLTIECGLE